MLLPPETTYHVRHFPEVWQLGRVEREALRAELSGLTESLSRTTRSYLGSQFDLGPPELLWRPDDMKQAMPPGGPAMLTRLGQGGRMVMTLEGLLADRCVTALLGYLAAGQSAHTALTEVDRAILKPYLSSLADSVTQTLLGRRGRHELLPAASSQRFAEDGDVFGLIFPLVTDSAKGKIIVSIPTEAWRTRLAENHESDQPQLSLAQLGQAPVRLEAVLPGVALSVNEVATMQPGDVIPLPQGQQMTVRLQAGDCVVATGRAGMQDGQLGVRVVTRKVPEEGALVMKENTTAVRPSDTQAPAWELISQLEGKEQRLELLSAIPVKVEIRLGQVTLPLTEVVALGSGSVVALDKTLGEAVEVLAGGRVVAYGEIVAVEDELGVRILRMAENE